MSVSGTVTLSRTIQPFFEDIGGFTILSREIGATNETVVLELTGGPTGLTGVMTVAIHTLTGDLVYGPSAANIIESPPDTGRYLATVPRPDVGRYLVTWSDGVSTTDPVELVVVDDDWLRPPLRAVPDTDYELKVGDLEPPLVLTFRNSDGEAIDLTPVVEIMSNIRMPDGQVIERTASILDPVAGRVMFVWEDGDTDTSGRYYDEWVMTLADDRTVTVPSSGGHIFAVAEEWGLHERWPGVAA